MCNKKRETGERQITGFKTQMHESHIFLKLYLLSVPDYTCASRHSCVNICVCMCDFVCMSRSPSAKCSNQLITFERTIFNSFFLRAQSQADLNVMNLVLRSKQEPEQRNLCRVMFY